MCGNGLLSLVLMNSCRYTCFTSKDSLGNDDMNSYDAEKACIAEVTGKLEIKVLSGEVKPNETIGFIVKDKN